ncbi:MAG: trypsin-like peptidase domain-containing protein [Polyangiaceae bacterium]|nr:trypsin-like peptidase domain-containing protein [Polyangiaceae bacterium]
MIRPRSVFALGLAFATAAACGGSTPPPSSNQNASSGELPAAGERRASSAAPLPRKRKVGSPKLADRRQANAVAADTLGVSRGRAAPPPRSAAEVYRAVAPATVIIRAGGGMGSGVLVDASGWILTNHHVVKGGEEKDFKLKVQVVLGKLDTKSGGMERDEKQYEAYVHKSDPLRDLALVKLVDPPPKLPFVKLAAADPVPGQQVMAIGHAGAGMLWAIKSGEISALGKLRDHLATLAQFKDDDDGKKAAEQFRKFLDDQNLGLVIQSSCQILPGDSGGPLVTQQGELIGLNAFSNRDGRTGGLLSFHIHRAELAAFVKEKPERVAQVLPDPWKEGGGDASVDDVDLDGTVDVLALEGRRACPWCPVLSQAVMVDLDQSSYPRGSTLPEMTEVYEKRGFDPELVLLELEGKRLIWYDTDNDGKHDVVLVDEGGSGQASSGYRLKPTGELERDAALEGGRDVRMSLFQDERLRQRLAAVASTAFPERAVEIAGGAAGSLPQPLAGTGRAETRDLDADGNADSVFVQGTFGARTMIDLDRSHVSRLPASFVIGRDVQPSALDAEVSVIAQATHLWTWYDTDDDGRMDLVLHAPGARVYAAVEAYRVDAAGNRTAAPEHVGRKLMRADLAPAPQAPALRAMVEKSFLAIFSSASDLGVASFPDIFKDGRGVSYELMDLKVAPRAVFVQQGFGSTAYVIDLDESSLKGKDLKKTNLEELATGGKLSGDFAYFQRNGVAWSFYDTDGKDGYDVVFFTTDPGRGTATHGFRVESPTKPPVYDPSFAGSPMVKPSLLKKKPAATKLAKIAAEIFSDRMREP